jgi:hypothetical protein
VEFAALGAVAALVLLAPAAMAWTPLALALGPALAALAVRKFVVVRMTRRATASAPALAPA